MTATASERSVKGADAIRSWFDRGHLAFKASFPHLAANLPYPFYVCPICLRAASEKALAQRLLTREHVPPKALGGHILALTCKDCNSTGGHAADNHARREADLFDLVARRGRNNKATLKTASSRVPVRVSFNRGVGEIAAVGNAASRTAHSAMQADFMAARGKENWRNFSFQLELSPYSRAKASASWLRSAYLAFFSALGYSFVCRSELDVVRTRIRHPGSEQPSRFRLLMRQEMAPTLLMVDEPSSLRSFMMWHGRNCILLPRLGDDDLYTRLVEQPSGTATFSGKQIEWPTGGPKFAADIPPSVADG
jgi:HNH endonuclease